MKMTDLRAKARAIFGPAFAEPMPNQPNGAKALQQRANARPIPTYKVGGPVKKPMPTPADLAAAKAQNEMIKKATVSKKDAAAIAAGNRASGLEGAEMRFMEMMEPKQNRQSMPMRSGKPPVYGVGKPAFPDSAASAASADRIAKQEADEKKLMDAMRGRDEGPRKPVTLKEKPVPVDLDEKRKKVRLNEKRVPVTLNEKRVRVDKMEYKTGGEVQTSSDTARKLATEMGGMKKGGKAKPKNGLAVMIAIGKPMKPAKKMNGGPMAAGSMDREASKVTREMAMGGDPMGYAAGGAGKTRKGQAPIKKAQGGAAKVRKGMMTPEGDIINVMNKMRGK
jgi:hypothetical protein